VNNLEEIRSEYRSDRLDLDNLDTDPIVQFRYWLNDAIRARIPEPTAMVLSTATAKGRPSSRVVLLKDLNREGFVFFTNYESRKGKQISENPYGSLLFYWPLLERQVRIEGTMTKTTRKQSDAYFLTRPEGSKIGAWSSPQSTRIPSRQYLDNLQQDYTLLFRNKAVERPENWGGYILIPEMFEFWQGRENRLHDRFEYTLNGNLWEINRLAP
jgi:pyridoxamine 5'-phosphate oxidase